MSLEELRRTAQQLAEKIQEQERIQEQQKEDQKSMGEGEQEAHLAKQKK